MKINLFFSFIFCTVLTNQGCDDTVKKSTPTDHGPFGEYWYQGKGEVNTYFLEQERYKEIRKGEAVMVFVTEDFSMKKTGQVGLSRTSRCR
jgi:hypothetical protein